MNILFIQQDVCLYGASRSLLALIDELVRRGHSCCVLLPKEGPLVAVLRERNVRYAIVHWRSWTCVEGTNLARRIGGGVRDWIYNLKQIPIVLRKLEGISVDIIHTNSSKTAFGGMLSSKMRKPHIWHFREFLGGEFSTGQVFRFGHRISQVYISGVSEGAVFISRALQSQFSKLQRLPINVIFNGIMPRGCMMALESTLAGGQESEFILSYVGRFDEWKQPLVALKAIRILRERGLSVRLILAGGGKPNDIKVAKEFVATGGFTAAVEFLGVLDDVAPVYLRSHAFVMPSRGDAFGRVTAEAMAYGRPVIGASAGATPELVKDGHNGLLFPVGNARALADAVLKLANDRQYLRELGANARKTALEQFTNESYAEAVLKVYERVIQTKPPHGKI